MNYLAHQFLAGNDREIRLGNFIADHVKGSRLAYLPEKVVAGIYMHRFIDSYTDSHLAVRNLKRFLRADLGKYTGVAIDVYFDHFLARDWAKFHPQALGVYTKEVYSIMNSYKGLIPEKAVGMLYYMELHDWLFHYGTMEGMHMALGGLSKRVVQPNLLGNATQVLEDNYLIIAGAFGHFLPDIIAEVKSKYPSLVLV